jgi:segregation and condensation protein B
MNRGINLAEIPDGEDPDGEGVGNELFDQDEEGVSLEELSKTYARLMVPPEDESPEAEDSAGGVEGHSDEHDGEDGCPVTPTSIIEAVLMVGRPDGGPIASAEIARLMRGVDEDEVVQLIAEINAMYEQTGRAYRIVDAGAGYRLQLADDLGFMVDLFYGRARPIRLNQAAIDILALVAYQPGISRETLEEQRGQNSGALLNQLVRRQLLEMRREGDAGRTPCYYPTDRLLQLVGLGSLDDLPQVEDW